MKALSVSSLGMIAASPAAAQMPNPTPDPDPAAPTRASVTSRSLADDRIRKILISGPLDFSLHAALFSAVSATAAGIERYVVDLSAVELIRDSGLGLLVALSRHVRRHGLCLELTGLTPPLRERIALIASTLESAAAPS